MDNPQHQRCLVCFSEVPTPLGEPEKPSENQDCLEQQLANFFIVKELLEISQDTCCKLLDYLQNWIALCPDCLRLVAQGRKLFEDIQKLCKEYKTVKEVVKLKIKVKVEDDGEHYQYSQIEAAIKLIRSEVRDNIDSIGSSILPKGSIISKRPSKTFFKKRKSRGTVSRKSVKILNDDQYLAINKNTRPKRSIKGHPKYTDFEEDILPDRMEEQILKEEIITTIEDYSMNDYSESHEENYYVADNEGDQIAEENDVNVYVPKDPLAREVHESEYEPNSDLDTEDEFKYDSNDTNKEEAEFEIIPDKMKKSNKTRRKPSAIEVRKPKKKNKSKGIKRKIPETLTLQQVIAKRESALALLPKYSKELTQEEKEKRKEIRQEVFLSKLCRMHKVKEFPCPTCERVFEKFADWHVHVDIDVCEKSDDFLKKLAPVVTERLACEECGSLVGCINALEDHYRRAHHPCEMSTCKGCSIIFKKAAEYQAHYYKAAKANPTSPCVLFGVKCPYTDICRRIVRNSQDALDIHLKLRHIAPPNHTFKCIQCDKTFPAKYNLRMHLDSHKTKEFKCDHENCSSAFTSLNRLKFHVKSIHIAKQEGTQFQCRFCTKTFVLQASRRRHERLHSTEDKYLCPECGKKFKLANYLTIHMYSHNPKLKYKYALYKNNAKAKAEMKKKQ